MDPQRIVAGMVTLPAVKDMDVSLHVKHVIKDQDSEEKVVNLRNRSTQKVKYGAQQVMVSMEIGVYQVNCCEA